MSNIRVLSPELAKIAINELNEKPDKVQSEIDSLKEWIRKTPHLNARTDDQFLLTFLRGCKHSIEKTKQKLDLFYTSRTFMPELMLNRFLIILHQVFLNYNVCYYSGIRRMKKYSH